ncbi:MAG: hypothetical protein ABS62_10295 [Microbacterium sp. SCN 70-200]|uniref:FAD-dependent monooxygenase n=1 Tax=unclassified Microbacterium TaxID=2609290 RepID=UPI00086A3281|nr:MULTISPECIES: FAD-dependent monooxygenase [unclassified Microbacterium]MBN9213329.1 FAD-dependent monooxygenase [Microbacterium sp.]ODT40548.1 MAG: hypothetical protein ABS62_10295 [Microbacterium sp. SCN 70-200]OJV84980.1 MAG: hypothetical protein BGO46_10285 [Microbacterium sp. 70-16]
MALVSRALIVGGGIAGLSAAIALEQIGIDVDVVELADQFGAVGAGMGIAGRAPNALAELGVYEQVAADGQPGLAAPGMYASDGSTLMLPPAKPDIPAGGLMPIGVYRPALAATLVDRASELGARLLTGTTVDEIVETEDAVEVTFSTGGIDRYDIVIGADGCYSKVRELVFPEAPEPEYAGQMSVRWLSDATGIEPEGWYVQGEQGRMAFYYQPYPDKTYCPFVLNLPRTRLSQEEAYVVLRDFMAQYTAPAIVQLRDHLKPDDEIIPRPFDWILLEKWHRGRVLLIGDAAHATTAHMGMGGGMALEDGVVLAQELQSAASIEDAFQSFRERRWPRVSAVVNTSVALSQREQQNLPTGPEQQKLMGGAIAVLNQPY